MKSRTPSESRRRRDGVFADPSEPRVFLLRTVFDVLIRILTLAAAQPHAIHSARLSFCYQLARSHIHVSPQQKSTSESRRGGTSQLTRRDNRFASFLWLPLYSTFTACVCDLVLPSCTFLLLSSAPTIAVVFFHSSSQLIQLSICLRSPKN